MDSMAKIFFERAKNESRLASGLIIVSENLEIKRLMGVNDSDTFYSASISHAYYSIFYAAKALLLTENVKTAMPEEHKKTYNEFKKISPFKSLIRTLAAPLGAKNGSFKSKSVSKEYVTIATAVRKAKRRPPRKRQPSTKSGTLPINIIKPMGQPVK